MADAGKKPQDSPRRRRTHSRWPNSEAEAAEAEALAAAARARARAIKLRRDAQAIAEPRSIKPPRGRRCRRNRDRRRRLEATEATRTEATETAEPSDAAEPSRAPPVRALNVALALTIAAVVAICALLGVSGWMVWHHQNVLQERQRAAAYVAAARQGVINLTSLISTRPRKASSGCSTVRPVNSETNSKSAQRISRRW